MDMKVVEKIFDKAMKIAEVERNRRSRDQPVDPVTAGVKCGVDVSENYKGDSTTTTVSENVTGKSVNHNPTDSDEDKKNPKALQLLTDATSSCSNETPVRMRAYLVAFGLPYIRVLCPGRVV